MGLDFENAFKVENLKKYFQEAFGTAIFLMLATAGGGANAYQWGISFVVMTTFFNGENHFNTYYTFYKAFCDHSMCMVQGFMYMLCQFLGAFVAHKLSGAIGHNQDAVAGFEFDNWKAGLIEFVMVSLFLWMYLHAKGNGNIGDMPNGLFVIFTVALCFMWSAGGAWSFNRFFFSVDSLKGCAASLVWGLAACIVTNLKMFFLFDGKAFWDMN